MFRIPSCTARVLFEYLECLVVLLVYYYILRISGCTARTLCVCLHIIHSWIARILSVCLEYLVVLLEY